MEESRRRFDGSSYIHPGLLSFSGGEVAEDSMVALTYTPDYSVVGSTSLSDFKRWDDPTSVLTFFEPRSHYGLEPPSVSLGGSIGVIHTFQKYRSDKGKAVEQRSLEDGVIVRSRVDDEGASLHPEISEVFPHLSLDHPS